MEEKLRWGVLGYARIAQNAVIPAITKAKSAEFYGMASKNSQKREECRKRFNCPQIYESYEGLIADPRIHAVYIPLPNGMHKDWVMRAAEHGKHVLCEKPIGLNAKECREMIDVCRSHGVQLAEAFMYRYSLRVRKLQELINSGTIGELRAIHASFSFLLDREDDFRWDPHQGGGALYDVGCYPLNLIGMMTQAKPESIAVECQLHRGVDRALSAVLKYQNGLLATIECGFNAYFHNHAEIVGTKGTIQLPEIFLGKSRTVLVTTDEGRKNIITPWNNPYRNEIEAFGESIQTGQSTLVDLTETIRNMEIIDQILGMIH